MAETEYEHNSAVWSTISVIIVSARGSRYVSPNLRIWTYFVDNVLGLAAMWRNLERTSFDDTNMLTGLSRVWHADALSEVSSSTKAPA